MAFARPRYSRFLFRIPSFPNDASDDRMISRSGFDLSYLSDIVRDMEERFGYRRCTPRRGSRRLLDLSDVSDRLRHDAAVVTAFRRLDAVNLVLAPEVWHRDANVIVAACDAHPAVIWHVPPCPTRSGLVSLLPFVVRLLKESAPADLGNSSFETLPTSIREDREVSFVAAATQFATKPPPRWCENVDFWCEAMRRTGVDLHKCYNLIPKRHLLAPPILDAVARHPLLCDLRRNSQAHSLFEAMLRRVSGRESLRECVRHCVSSCWLCFQSSMTASRTAFRPIPMLWGYC